MRVKNEEALYDYLIHDERSSVYHQKYHSWHSCMYVIREGYGRETAWRVQVDYEVLSPTRWINDSEGVRSSLLDTT